MSHVTFWQAFDAEAAIAAHRIVKDGGADHAVVQADDDTAAIVGVSGRSGGAAAGRVEIAREGIADIEYGAAVTRGQMLTADADGKAIPASGPGLFQMWVDGAAANTDIAVTGIRLTDELVDVWELETGNANNVHNRAGSITADGTIQIAQATTNDRVLVTWRRHIHVIGKAEVSGAAGDIGEVHLNPHSK